MNQSAKHQLAAPSRRDENRRVLVQAARDGLLSEGLAGLRFERIAAAASMTRMSVYNHFKSKVGLYEALMDDIGNRAGFRGMADVWAKPTSQDILTAYFAELTRGWAADQDMFRLMIGLSAADPELGAAVSARVGRVEKSARVLTERLAKDPGLAPGWTVEDAFGCVLSLAVFTAYDTLRRSGMDHATSAARLAQLAACPFAFSRAA